MATVIREDKPCLSRCAGMVPGDIVPLGGDMVPADVRVIGG